MILYCVCLAETGEHDNVGETLSTSNDYAILSFIMSAALILPALTVISKSLNRLCNKKVKCIDHHGVFYTWIIVSCLLACILNILNLFDNILNKGSLMKSGRSCYYIYVFEATFMCMVGFIMSFMLVDLLMNVMNLGALCCYYQEKKVRIHFICVSILAVSFVLNDLSDILGHVDQLLVPNCWKGNAFGINAVFFSKVDLALQFTLCALLIGLCLVIRKVTKSKLVSNSKVCTPGYLYVEDVEEIEIEEPPQPRRESDQTPSSDVVIKIENENKIYKQCNDELKQEQTKGLRKPNIFRHSRQKTKTKFEERSESSGHENSGYLSDTGDTGGSMHDDECFMDVQSHNSTDGNIGQHKTIRKFNNLSILMC